MDKYYFSEEKAYNIVEMGASPTHKSVATLNISCLYKFYVYFRLFLFPGRKHETSGAISGKLITLDGSFCYHVIL